MSRIRPLAGVVWTTAAFVLAVLSFPAAAASYRMVEGAKDSTVILPPDFIKNEKHAALILLPYTGGTARDLFNWYYASSYGRHDIRMPVIVLLGEEGKRRDYRNGEVWAKTVAEYDKEVTTILADLIPSYHIDPKQIAIGGFSMGGDLGWALAMRNPEMFHGLVIMGSRCNWREGGVGSKLRRNGTRVAYFIGDEDKSERLAGAHAARTLLEKSGVDLRYTELPDRGHAPVPPNTFWETVAWLFDNSEPSTAAVIPVANVKPEQTARPVRKSARKSSMTASKTSARRSVKPPIEATQ